LDSTATTDEEVYPNILSLYRKIGISGRIFDPDLKRPVPNVRVSALRVAYSESGRTVLGPSDGAPTDEDGRFQLAGLSAGQYYLEVQPNQKIDERITLGFSKEDADKVELAYTQSRWPDFDPDKAVPIAFGGGGSFDAGDILLSRSPVFRARVALRTAACDAEEKVSVTLLLSRDGGRAIQARGQVPCDREFLITDLLPGRYQLDAGYLEKFPDRRETADADLEIVDRNVRMELVLQRGVDVTGRVTAPSENWKPALSMIRVDLTSLFGLSSSDYSFAAVDSEGAFNLVNCRVRDYRVSLKGLREDLLVKQMAYNGNLLPEGVLHFDPGAPVHSLTIVLSDKPAAVFGQVIGRDGPLKGAVVVLVKWPLGPDNSVSYANTMYTAEGGGYRFGGLAPGGYRLFALSPTFSGNFAATGVFAKLLARAKDLRLDEGGMQTVTLEITEP
jgi:hypothetical protein